MKHILKKIYNAQTNKNFFAMLKIFSHVKTSYKSNINNKKHVNHIELTVPSYEYVDISCRWLMLQFNEICCRVFYLLLFKCAELHFYTVAFMLIIVYTPLSTCYVCKVNKPQSMQDQVADAKHIFNFIG